MQRNAIVVIRGGGDLGTGVAHRLARSNYRVVVLETARPRVVRRAAALAQAVPDGDTIVEGVIGRRSKIEDLPALLAAGRDDAAAPGPVVPVAVDPEGRAIELLRPDAIVDARMAKRNLGTSSGAAVTIGLGPGFVAGSDVDFVIETKRGNGMGRLIEKGAAESDTGIPGEVAGIAEERLIRSPAAGRFEATCAIGDVVAAGAVVGRVAGSPVAARIDGLLRGLIADGTDVENGEKIGDVDPRGSSIDPTAISDKARSMGGAVLEALLSRGILPAGADD